MSPAQLSANNTESGHQKAVFAWCAMAVNCGVLAADDPLCYTMGGWAEEMYCGPHGQKGSGHIFSVPALRMLYANPNGGLRNAVTAGRLKAEGVRPGLPDMHLPVASRTYHSLYIELKAGNGRASKEQLAFGEHLKSYGNAWFITVGWQETIMKLKWYLEI